MLCQSCGQNTANTHIKTIVNGELTEHHLCAKCAGQMGYGSLFDGMSMSNLIGSFFAGAGVQNLPPMAQAARCEMCGSTFSDIARSGKVGCADCYMLYRDQLLPTVQRVHGNTNHIGKVPASAGKQMTRANEIEALKRALQEAVAAQEFERAAQLRDEIREKEAEHHE